MKLSFKKTGFISLILALFALFTLAPAAYAATSPSLGSASTFVILSSTYTNTVAGTTLTGDLGYTTGPAVAPTVSGATHVADSVYNQAGIDQGTVLSALNSQACTFTFAPGAIDLATDTTHGTIGIYAPGVYCITGAASIGTAGITLSNSGTYIFRMTGALTTVVGSSVNLVGGLVSCDVFWTPGAATTLAANSAFAGRDIDASGITIGNLATWTGRALAFGGTVSTSRNTITAPTCAVDTPVAGIPAATPAATPAAIAAAAAAAAAAASTTTPGLPNTGLSAQHSAPWWSIGALVLAASSALYLARKKV